MDVKRLYIWANIVFKQGLLYFDPAARWLLLLLQLMQVWQGQSAGDPARKKNKEFALKVRNRLLAYFENKEGSDFRSLLDLLSLATDSSQLYINITLQNLELSNDLEIIKGLVSDSLIELMSESKKMK